MSGATVDVGAAREMAEYLDAFSAAPMRRAAEILRTLADEFDALGAVYIRTARRAEAAEAELARLRAALPGNSTLMRAASMLDSDYPGVANGLRIAAARIRALAAGADT